MGYSSPRTMGKSAKGPAGMAGFLKEKSQNELLRGKLLLSPYTSHPNLLHQAKMHTRGQCVLVGGRWGDIACRVESISTLPSSRPPSLAQEQGRKVRNGKAAGPTLGLPAGQRLIAWDQIEDRSCGSQDG